MKQITLWVTLLLSGMLANAQYQFQNSGFENWTNHTVNGYSFADPENWYSLNELQAFGFPQTTLQTTQSHNGTYGVHLVSVTSAFGKLPGLLTVRPLLNDEGNPDFSQNMIPFAYRPLAISFWFKSYPEDEDANAMHCVLTKWNATTSTRDTMAIASWSKDTIVSSYTKALINFNYLNTQNPDSLFLIFSSSEDGFNPVVGSELFIDDIQLEYSVGLNESSVNEIQVYPNPFKDHIIIRNLEEGTLLTLTNTQGQSLFETSVINPEVELPLIPEGLYFLHLGNPKGGKQQTFLLQKTN